MRQVRLHEDGRIRPPDMGASSDVGRALARYSWCHASEDVQAFPEHPGLRRATLGPSEHPSFELGKDPSFARCHPGDGRVFYVQHGSEDVQTLSGHLGLQRASGATGRNAPSIRGARPVFVRHDKEVFEKITRVSQGLLPTVNQSFISYRSTVVVSAAPSENQENASR